MKVERLISIIMILLDKERISAQALAERFEVSPRTIYRDIDAIDRAGIPVRSTSGVGGGFEIMPKYKIDKQFFSTTDLSAILMGLSGLSNILRGEELINALVKVKSVIPAEKAQDIDLKANHVHIDLSSWVGNRNIQPHMELIKRALEKQKLLSFDYADRHGTKTARRAEPYQLVLKSSHWYCQAYCLKRKAFRLFKLTRLANLHIEEETFLPRAFQKPQLEFNDELATLQTKINIRIHHSIMDRVLDFCDYEDLLPDGPEHYVVQFPFIENDFYYNILFSFGNKCQCLGPSSIRKEMKRRIDELARLYEC